MAVDLSRSGRKRLLILTVDVKSQRVVPASAWHGWLVREILVEDVISVGGSDFDQLMK